MAVPSLRRRIIAFHVSRDRRPRGGPSERCAHRNRAWSTSIAYRRVGGSL